MLKYIGGRLDESGLTPPARHVAEVHRKSVDLGLGHRMFPDNIYRYRQAPPTEWVRLWHEHGARRFVLLAVQAYGNLPREEPYPGRAPQGAVRGARRRGAALPGSGPARHGLHLHLRRGVGEPLRLHPGHPRRDQETVSGHPADDDGVRRLLRHRQRPRSLRRHLGAGNQRLQPDDTGDRRDPRARPRDLVVHHRRARRAVPERPHRGRGGRAPAAHGVHALPGRQRRLPLLVPQPVDGDGEPRAPSPTPAAPAPAGTTAPASSSTPARMGRSPRYA